MKSTELKARLARICNLAPSQLSVDTSASKRANRWVGIRIRPSKASLWAEKLDYPAEFPAWLRQTALAIVYGPDSTTGQQTIAGNVREHSIALLESEWARFFETVDAVAACSTTPGNEATVALSYLRNRNPITA